MHGQRFLIRRDAFWRPVLVPFGAGDGRSFIEVQEGTLRLRFGWIFDERLRLAEILEARRAKCPWWGGIGWRYLPRGRIGLFGSYEGIVELRLARRRWMSMLLPFPADRLSVSLEEPDRFLATLELILRDGPH